MRARAHSPPRASATTSSASRNSPAPSAKPQLPLPRRRLRPSPRRPSLPRRLRLLRPAHRKRARLRSLHLRLRRHARHAPTTRAPATAARVRARPTTPALQPREGGRPREIDIPAPARAKPDADAPKRITRAPVTSEEDDNRGGPKGLRKPGAARTPTPKPDEKRERVKLTINNAFDEKQRERSLASLKRKREREKLKAMGISQSREKIVREVVIPEVITIQELANRMAERAVDVIKYLMKEGAMHKINDVVDVDTAELIVQEFGHTPKRVSEADVETRLHR